MSEINIAKDMLVQEAKRYAVNIVRETPLFKNFAVNMIDFAGRDICPYLVEIYKEMSSILFTEGLPQDNLDYVEGLKMDEMLSWYDSYKASLDDWEKRQAEFKENIDELQFLTDEYRKSDEFKKMLDFVGKFNYIAAYNAMLIEMQKPGAETVAWLVCKRHGIKNPSEEYLAVYAPKGEIPICSTDAIMKAVAEIEKMLRDDLRVRQAQWYKEDRNFKDDVDYAFKKLKEQKEANKK